MFSFREKDAVLSSSWPSLNGRPWQQWIINHIYSFPFLMLITVILKFELAVELPGEFTKHRFLGPTSSAFDSVGLRPQAFAFRSFPGHLMLLFWILQFEHHWLTTSTCTAPWQFPFSHLQTGFPDGLVGKKSCDTGDMGSIPGSGRSPGEGNGYLLQYSCLKKSHG